MWLFVYGSLLRGEENHGVLAAARLVARARTVARYTLVDLGPYPALLEGGDTAVAGEIYEVEEELLAVLDEFEGHPDVYVRRSVDIEAPEVPEIGGRAEAPEIGGRAEAYVLPAERAAGHPVVASGDWRAHRLRRETR